MPSIQRYIFRQRHTSHHAVSAFAAAIRHDSFHAIAFAASITLMAPLPLRHATAVFRYFTLITLFSLRC